jgi:hypothetical protein
MHIAAAISLIALIGVAVALGYLHVVPTGLSPIHNAVSQYGITEHRMGYRVATISFAIAGLTLAVALNDATNHRDSATFRLLIVFAVARAVISWFPMDQPGISPRTRTGTTHGLLAIAAFGSACAAAFKLAHTLTHETRLHSLASASTTLGVLMLICLLSMLLARSVPEIGKRFGLIERGFYAIAIIWFAVFSITCIFTTD